MEGFKLLCLGDSLTEGYGIDLKDGWVSLLRDREGWDITNAGISGDMTAGMLARLSLELEKRPCTHVFIMGGTNDVEFGLPPNLIVSNIKAMMRQLRYRGIHCTVGIPIPFNDERTTLTRFQYVQGAAGYRKKLETFCGELKAFLREDEADFIDFGEAFLDGKGQIRSGWLLPDGVHPNEKGHEAMSRLVHEHYAAL